MVWKAKVGKWAWVNLMYTWWRNSLPCFTWLWHYLTFSESRVYQSSPELPENTWPLWNKQYKYKRALCMPLYGCRGLFFDLALVYPYISHTVRADGSCTGLVKGSLNTLLSLKLSSLDSERKESMVKSKSSVWHLVE